MKIALYVHDLRLEVGHSNSLIELIRNLPESKKRMITDIEVVNFTCMKTEELFPDLNLKVKRIKVPFEGLKPFFLKAIFYQVWTFIYNRFFQEKGFFKIGIGICCLDVDAVSIQFIHKQWTEKGLEMEKGFWLRTLYKKMLFFYFETCESYLFSKRNLKFFSPAQFLTDYLNKNFKGIQTRTIYSGINLNRFVLNSDEKRKILDKVTIEYPILSGLNLQEPIFIFVGAYERKGIEKALEIVKKRVGAQFIVVGSPSMGRTVVWPNTIKVFPIQFTKRIQDFYSLSDVFVFPTLYEPFGLVLFEAVAMGLMVITRQNEVGASELIRHLPEVYFIEESEVDLNSVKVKNFTHKNELRNKRLELLGDVSWCKAGQELDKFLFQS